MELFKDDRLKKLCKLIQTSIKGTFMEGKVFICGGCIRDSILDLPINDVDIVVEARSGGAVFANYMTLKHQCYTAENNPTLIGKYGTYKFQLYKNEELKDLVIECCESRKSLSEFGTVYEDARRRDLTINALMYNVSKEELIDYNGTAIQDLRTMTLRGTKNAESILQEDPIKILRIIYFSTKFGWGIEKYTWLAMIKNAPLIIKVPQEKISTEIIKILMCKNPSNGIRKMYYCGVLNKVMQDIYDTTYAFESKNPMVTTFEHTMKVLDTVQPRIEARLAALFHDVGRIITSNRRDVEPDKFSAEIAAEDLKKMKFSHHIIKSVETAIKYHRAFLNYGDGVLPNDKKIRKFLNLVGDDMPTTLDLMNANNLYSTYNKKKRQVLDILNRIEKLEEIDKKEKIKLPINGTDIQKEFDLKPSPKIGMLLDCVKDAYFENPNITKDEAFEIIKNKLYKFTSIVEKKDMDDEAEK